MNRRIHAALEQLATDALASANSATIQADVTELIKQLKAAEVVPHTVNYGL